MMVYFKILNIRFIGKILNKNTKHLMTTAKRKRENPSGLLHAEYRNYQENPALNEGKNQETIEQFSRHKFLDGLSAVDIQDRLLCLEFTSFDQLIETAERHDTTLEQREARM